MKAFQTLHNLSFLSVYSLFESRCHTQLIYFRVQENSQVFSFKSNVTSTTPQSTLKTRSKMNFAVTSIFVSLSDEKKLFSFFTFHHTPLPSELPQNFNHEKGFRGL